MHKLLLSEFKTMYKLFQIFKCEKAILCVSHVSGRAGFCGRSTMPREIHTRSCVSLFFLDIIENALYSFEINCSDFVNRMNSFLLNKILLYSLSI